MRPADAFLPQEQTKLCLLVFNQDLKKISVFKFCLAKSQQIYVCLAQHCGCCHKGHYLFICMFIHQSFGEKESTVEIIGKELTRVTKSLQKRPKKLLLPPSLAHCTTHWLNNSSKPILSGIRGRQ